MADKEDNKRPLKNLLESVYEVHRNDIKTYASGHLNPSKLFKIQTERHSEWESSKKPLLRTKPASHIVDYPVRVGQTSNAVDNQRKMQDALVEFSLGPVGSMIGGAGSSVLMEGDEEGNASKDITLGSAKVEELHLPEIMIPVAQKGQDGYKSTFIQSYLNQPTKTDQFACFKDFGDKVINLNDASDRGVLTGEKTVRILQKRLSKKLNLLDSTSQHGPNFHKLQVYTDTWQDIIEHSNLFGGILQQIKEEYDSYMSHLLDTQRPSQHRLLYQHLDSLSQDQSVSAELVKEQERVAKLEKEARQILEENQRLKIELKEEEERAAEDIENLLTKEPPPRTHFYVEDVPKDLEEQVNDLHSEIMEKIDEIEALKRYQREECVPISVCHHLEKCVKETEVDIQKLNKQNEFLEKSIDELEKELVELLEKSTINKTSARKLWSKINTDFVKLGKPIKKKKKKHSIH